MFQLEHYLTGDDHDVFAEWHGRLKDIKAKLAIDRRLAHVEAGNFGDHKPLRDGVWELRIDVGQGYRVYYAQTGKTVLLLLCGGDKRRQNADVSTAVAYWKDWQDRSKEK